MVRTKQQAKTAEAPAQEETTEKPAAKEAVAKKEQKTVKAAKAATRKGKGKGKKAAGSSGNRVVYTVDCSTPIQHGLFDIDAYKQFLEQRIKVNGKTGLKGDAVKVSAKDNVLTVDALAPFSKRYVKYLTKKFLKKTTLRDWLRVVATNKTNYQLKYFNIHDNEE